MNRHLLVCLVVLVGCATPEQAPVAGESTTTSSTPTTTSSAAPTTSTLAPTTTTDPVSEGDALVVSESFVLGWWADGAWRQEPEYRPLEAGAEFQIFSVDGDTHSVTGGAPAIACEWAGDDIRHIPLESSADSSLFGPIGVSAPWAVESGEAEHAEADQSLIDIAVSLLADVGIDESNPVFAQVIETDLDADGTSETLAVLDNDAGVFDAEEDAYGIAFIVHENSDVQALGEYDIYADDAEGSVHIVAQYRFLAVMDVNKDGTDEVAMHWASFESGGEILFAVDSDTSQLTRVLGQGCGV